MAIGHARLEVNVLDFDEIRYLKINWKQFVCVMLNFTFSIKDSHDNDVLYVHIL